MCISFVLSRFSSKFNARRDDDALHEPSTPTNETLHISRETGNSQSPTSNAHLRWNGGFVSAYGTAISTSDARWTIGLTTPPSSYLQRSQVQRHHGKFSENSCYPAMPGFQLPPHSVRSSSSPTLIVQSSTPAFGTRNLSWNKEDRGSHRICIAVLVLSKGYEEPLVLADRSSLDCRSFWQVCSAGGSADFVFTSNTNSALNPLL